MTHRAATSPASICLMLFAASCAMISPEPRDEALSARAEAALAQGGVGSDALELIDNMLRHEPGTPAAAPALVRAALARPLGAADAEALFHRAVPRELHAFEGRAPLAAPATFDELLAAYIEELAAARALLRRAAGSARIDTAAILKELEAGPPSREALLDSAAVDEALLRRANERFVLATARFVNSLRVPRGALRLPDGPLRFDSPVGVVSVGTRGDDRHGPDAALIVDPGGNDDYERAPATGGAVSVVIDLEGRDTYRGSDVAVHGLSALVDFSGDDRYAMAPAGLGAALAGASLLIDFSGNDSYESGFFAQGAAAFGLGALVDFDGDDRYRVLAGGQGFSLAGGIGLLWDRAGNDRYVAAGPPDPYSRGGSISFAQGSAFGHRTMLGGGVGILRDDAGDDAYEAEMFAQGTGYYYGLGLLWDRSGNDSYGAIRYAQGNGVHEAVGVLRDESGNDRYELRIGVGQGMGLDLAVGMLYDAAGDDRYRASYHAQGNATGNGIGVLFDSGGSDQWHMSADPRAWGHAEPARALPSFGLVLYEPAAAAFFRDGSSVAPPRAGAPLEDGEPGQRGCPPAPAVPPHATASFAEALRSLEFLFRGRPADPATHAYVQQRLTRELDSAIAELPGDDFVIAWLLGNTLPCALRQASSEEASSIWNAMERVLAANPANPFAFAIVLALHERRAPPAQLQRLLRSLGQHPSCAVRAAALLLEDSAAAARSALRSTCWHLQATALQALRKAGIEVPADSPVPSFLRRGRAQQ